MLRCPTCGSEDEFLVTETISQVSRVRVDGPYDYTFIAEEAFLEVVEWENVQCGQCAHDMSEDEAKEAYEQAHPEETPIPYTLVDASVS